MKAPPSIGMIRSSAVTGVDEEPPQPGVESVRVTESGQVAPRDDEGLLRGGLGTVGIPDDEPGDAVELIDPEACQL